MWVEFNNSPKLLVFSFINSVPNRHWVDLIKETTCVQLYAHRIKIAFPCISAFFSSPGEKQHPLMSHEHSLVIHDTLDKIRCQIGLVYEEDKI